MTRYAVLFVGVLIPALTGCSGSGTTTTNDPVSQAIALAATTHTDATTCFSTFQSCIDAAAGDADVKACQDALASCLPQQSGMGGLPVPDLCSDQPPPDHRSCDGGMPPGDGQPPPPPGAGGQPPPPPDGQQPPPPPDGQQPPPPPGDGGAPPPPPPGGDHHHPPLSPAGAIALATCHAELQKCLAAGTDQSTCITTDHQCVHDALVADFAALCQQVTTQCAACATSARCVDLTARCATGVPFGDAPGGTTAAH